jgi:hypothetical protein
VPESLPHNDDALKQQGAEWCLVRCSAIPPAVPLEVAEDFGAHEDVHGHADQGHPTNVQWETDPVNGQAREAQQHCFVEGSPDKFEQHAVGHCPAEMFPRDGS